MKIFNCEHPNTFRNPHTGVVMTIPCGKCKVCQQRRALQWVDRLEKERKCHPYCYFFTLTYSEKFCPKYHIYGKNLFDRSTGEVITLSDIQYQDNKDYLDGREFVCHPSVIDLQNFLKRIRSKINYYEKDSSRKVLRYFIVSEYGPTLEKHRIHYHGIFFSDSYWFARNFKEVIDSAWSTDNRCSVGERIGWTKSRFVSDNSAAHYSAAYMYFTTDLPRLYECKSLRPIKLCSRHPALGSLLSKDEEVQRYLIDGVTRISEYNERTSSYVYKPLPSYIKGRLFPKIKGFGQISHFDRVRLYSFIYERQSEIGSLGEFITYLRKLRPRLNLPDGVIPSLYIRDNSQFVVDEWTYNYFLDMMPSYDYDSLLLDTDYMIYCKDKRVQRCVRFMSACNRVYHNMALYNISSVDTYVRLMEQYDENCIKQNLIEQFDLLAHQSEYPEALELIDFDYAERHGLNPTESQLYKDMINKSSEIKSKNQKKKEKYAYMRKYNYKIN